VKSLADCSAAEKQASYFLDIQDNTRIVGGETAGELETRNSAYIIVWPRIFEHIGILYRQTPITAETIHLFNLGCHLRGWVFCLSACLWVVGGGMKG